MLQKPREGRGLFSRESASQRRRVWRGGREAALRGPDPRCLPSGPLLSVPSSPAAEAFCLCRPKAILYLLTLLPGPAHAIYLRLPYL